MDLIWKALTCLLATTLLPTASAGHPNSDSLVVDPVGEMYCEGKQVWGQADEHWALTGAETGHLDLIAPGFAYTNEELPCDFAVRFDGFSCIGTSTSVCSVTVAASNPCSTTSMCLASLSLDWDRCFLLSGCVPNTWTAQIDVFYSLHVNGNQVDADVVHILDPPLVGGIVVTNPL